MDNNEFDVIVVGSGASGAALARDLSRRGVKVLLLERGAGRVLTEKLSVIAAIAREFPVAEGLKATTAYTVGGATSIYFGVCKLPTGATFDKLGIDLSRELEEVRRELPIAELSDAFLPPQSIAVRDSARALGYPMKTHPMLVDPSKCPQGRYSYEAKWKATAFVEEAVADGALLATRARVARVIVENGRAVGVEYVHGQGGGVRKAYGRKIVLCAGSPATPKLLIDAGIDDVGSRGFFCKPAFMVFGSVPGLAGRDAFLGMTECDLGNGITLGDGAMTSSLFKLFMLSNLKPSRLFAHASTVSVAVALNDAPGGRIDAKGNYSKRMSPAELDKLKAAEGIARRILENAGAGRIFRSKYVAGTPGGVLWIGEHLDHDLQTRIPDLYVCDQSLVPDVTITPLVLLVCLAKRLANHLALSLREPAAIEPAPSDVVAA
jgi:GMC oxidoreductase/NAD(P)-binding Rossmann-like domain